MSEMHLSKLTNMKIGGSRGSRGKLPHFGGIFMPKNLIPHKSIKKSIRLAPDPQIWKISYLSIYIDASHSYASKKSSIIPRSRRKLDSWEIKGFWPKTPKWGNLASDPQILKIFRFFDLGGCVSLIRF